MTVGELKKALRKVSSDAEVLIPGCDCDSCGWGPVVVTVDLVADRVEISRQTEA